MWISLKEINIKRPILFALGIERDDRNVYYPLN